jgi:hypothetical protein
MDNLRFDIQQDDNGLIIEDQDFVWDLSDDQHIEDTINSWPGWWKENFSDGVGVSGFLNSDGQDQILSRLIKIELESDLYEVQNPSVIFGADGTLDISPNVI